MVCRCECECDVNPVINCSPGGTLPSPCDGWDRLELPAALIAGDVAIENEWMDGCDKEAPWRLSGRLCHLTAQRPLAHLLGWTKTLLPFLPRSPTV